MEPTTLSHVLLTRFSYRANLNQPQRNSGDDGWARFDPLDPTRLDFRFALFECACLPNVMAQTSQNFDWVLIVDPHLPPTYRERLQKLVAQRARTYLHDYHPDDNLAGLAWLAPYTDVSSDLILTTNLDDDDILTLDFVEIAQSHIKALGHDVPSVKFLGLKTTYQWELFSSSKYPFGKWAPWHRVNWFRSTGLSLLCRSTMHQLSCLALHHSLADVWYVQGDEHELENVAREVWNLPEDDTGRFPTKELREFQAELDKSTVAGAQDWTSRPVSDLYHDLSEEGLFAIHLNHFMNDQAARLFETKPGTERLVENQFFPKDVRIDWNVFRKHRDLFRLSLRRYKNVLPEIAVFVKEFRLTWWKQHLLTFAYRLRVTWWFLRH